MSTASTNTKPFELSGYFKRGSSWSIKTTRRDSTGAVVDMTGLTTRAMFRVDDVTGPLKFTLTEGDGITITDPTTGIIILDIGRTRSASFTAGDKVFFDVEQTNPLLPEYEWHSKTCTFKVVEQVTVDD